MFRVYTLTNDEGRAAYVGSTARALDLRLAWHVSSAKRTSAPVAVWIRLQLQRGARPRIRLVAEARSREEAAALEHAWLTHLEASGAVVLNVRRRCYVPTLDHRRAISTALRGRAATVSTRWRMAAAQRRRAAQRRAAA